MSDLPSINYKLEAFKKEITKMRRFREGSYLKPHKLVMLLTVIELVELGFIRENKIFLTPQLIDVFEKIFCMVQRDNDWCQPGIPFFHLRSSGFWFHKVRPGHEKEYNKLTTTGGGLQIIDTHIEYAYLREDVFELIKYPKTRNELRRFISDLIGLEG